MGGREGGEEKGEVGRGEGEERRGGEVRVCMICSIRPSYYYTTKAHSMRALIKSQNLRWEFIKENKIVRIQENTH